MFILELLSPKYIPRKMSEWSIHMHFYRWILKCLYRNYCKGAISDTIHIGNTKIVHNVRDYWYEQELQRFKINVTSHMEKNKAFQRRVKYFRSRVFNWSESLIVYHDGQNYNVIREKYVGIDSNMDGQLKTSSGINTIFRIEFIANVEKQNKKQDTSSVMLDSSSLIKTPKSRSGRHKISIKDNIPKSTDTISHITSEDNSQPSITTSSKTNKYQGFEENDIF